jgi:hypothetical protein
MDESWELDNILIMPEQATLLLRGFGAVMWFDSAHHRLRIKR